MSRCVQPSELRTFLTKSGELVDLDMFSDRDLSVFIDLAVDLFEKTCGTKFSIFRETWLLDGTGDDMLRLPPAIPYPLIEVEGTIDVVDTDESVEASFEHALDFEPAAHYIQKVVGSPERPRLMIGSGYTWPEGRRNIKVTGKFGQPCPAPVKRAIMLYAIETLSPGITGLRPNDVASESWPDYSVSYRVDKGAKGDRVSLFGFQDIDRLLRPYVNMSSMITSGFFDGRLVSSAYLGDTLESTEAEVLHTGDFSGVLPPLTGATVGELAESLTNIINVLRGGTAPSSEGVVLETIPLSQAPSVPVDPSVEDLVTLAGQVTAILKGQA